MFMRKDVLNFRGGLLLSLFVVVFGFLATGCSKDDEDDGELSSELAKQKLIGYAWESSAGTEYSIGETYVDKDTYQYTLYFLEDGQGILKERHYSFDYVNPSHNTSYKGYVFYYTVNKKSVRVNCPDMYGFTYTFDLDDDALRSGSETYRRRSMTSDDRDFLSKWSFLTDDSKTDSSTNYGFDFQFNLLDTYKGGTDRSCYIYFKFGTDNIVSREVSIFSIEVDVVTPGVKLSGKNNYTSTVTQQYYNANRECILTVHPNAGSDLYHSWDMFLYFEKDSSMDEFELEVIPTWHTRSQGTIEGDSQRITVRI